MSGRPQIHFYYRDGCHLCEEMAAALHREWPEVFAAMVWIDVDRDPALQARYGTLVPVLTRDGETLCRYRLDPAAMRAGFGVDANPL